MLALNAQATRVRYSNDFVLCITIDINSRLKEHKFHLRCDIYRTNFPLYHLLNIICSLDTFFLSVLLSLIVLENWTRISLWQFCGKNYDVLNSVWWHNENLFVRNLYHSERSDLFRIWHLKGKRKYHMLCVILI